MSDVLLFAAVYLAITVVTFGLLLSTTSVQDASQDFPVEDPVQRAMIVGLLTLIFAYSWPIILPIFVIGRLASRDPDDLP